MSASVYKAVMGEEQYLERYWSHPDLQAALDAAYGDLGELREEPESPDRAVAESVIEDRIHALGTELRRRIRGGQDLEAARREARRYPPELVRRIKEVFDLREVVARDTGMSIPPSGLICSPLRDDDDTPSFKVSARLFYDFGSHDGGDVFTWRMCWHHVTWLQAVESLAAEAGIPIIEPAASSSVQQAVRL